MTAAITIHYKKASLTRRCVSTLLDDGWEPVLIWDNSADGGTSIRELELFFSDRPEVMIVVSPTNLGFGKGMNSALKHLEQKGYSGDTLLINNDTQVKRGMREAITNNLHNISTPTLTAPCLRQNKEERRWLYYHPWLALVTRSALPGSFPYLTGCCLLLSNIDTKEPLFDEDFFMYGEDVELSWRLQKQGGKLQLLEGEWLEHEGSASTGEASELYEQFLVRSHRLLAAKLASNRASKFWMQAARVPTLFARACLRSIRFKSLTPLKAYFSSY